MRYDCSMRMRWACVLVAIGSASCTKPNPRACRNGACSDPAYPYCDEDGFVDGVPGQCIAVTCAAGTFLCDGNTALTCSSSGDSYGGQACPKGCDPNVGCRMPCTPGTGLACNGDQLVVCGADGLSTSVQACPLGCSSTQNRCLTFDPSNGLGPALADASSQSDVVFSAGVVIDTDTGMIQDTNGNTVTVKSVLVQQVSASPIRVFEAQSFTIDDATVQGTNAIAFVSPGEISVVGRISARAHGGASGPGASTATTCAGKAAEQYQCGCGSCEVGAGGAGNYQAGGDGGAVLTGANSGQAVVSFAPLAGGCSGGDQLNQAGTVLLDSGGGGGGAVQLVSLRAITFQERGLIDVGGGGGESTTGGGSGGTVILEAPSVSFSGPESGVAANGGAGGGCGTMGADATTDTTAALGPSCQTFFGGNGGTGTMSPHSGCTPGVDTCMPGCPVDYGGGGGSAGRLRIATKDGLYATSSNPILSVGITTATLVPR